MALLVACFGIKQREFLAVVQGGIWHQLLTGCCVAGVRGEHLFAGKGLQGAPLTVVGLLRSVHLSVPSFCGIVCIVPCQYGHAVE